MHTCLAKSTSYPTLLRWFPEVQNIFYHGNKRKLIPLGQLESFFQSVAVLMTNLLREVALDSINDYYQIFCPPNDQDVPGKFPGFVVNVVLNGSSMEFEPNSQGFEIVVLNVFDKLVEAACSVPRVETKLYPNESAHASKPNLKPIVEAGLLDEAKARVSVEEYYIKLSPNYLLPLGESSVKGSHESTYGACTVIPQI